MLSGRDLVLIETYWNVNAHGMECMGTHPGINRNILECKLHGNWQKSSGFFSINRNILECK